LCGSFHRLGSCCPSAEALVVAWAEVEVCLIQIWSDGLLYLAWDMLFAVVAKGQLLKVVLGGFG
jgi:hypothetical protein